MTNEDFTIYYEKYYVKDRIIQRLARKLARTNYTKYKELIQAGLIGLWELDPSKAQKNEDSFIRRIINRRMIDFLRKEYPLHRAKNMESLDAILEAGGQVEKDNATDQYFVNIPTVLPAYFLDPDCEDVLLEEEEDPE